MKVEYRYQHSPFTSAFISSCFSKWKNLYTQKLVLRLNYSQKNVKEPVYIWKTKLTSWSQNIYCISIISL